jgi:hypothetical protein
MESKMATAKMSSKSIGDSNFGGSAVLRSTVDEAEPLFFGSSARCSINLSSVRMPLAKLGRSSVLRPVL